MHSAMIYGYELFCTVDQITYLVSNIWYNEWFGFSSTRLQAKYDISY